MKSQKTPRRLLVIGESGGARQCHESFQQIAPPEWEWLGVVSGGPATAGLGANVGLIRDLAEIALRHRATDLAVAVQHPDLHLCKTLLELAETGLRVMDVQTLHEQLTHRIPLLGDGGAWNTALACLHRQDLRTRTAKRMLDVIVGACGFAVFALVVIPVALALMIERAGSVFVADRRIGRFGRRFTLLRFRTERDRPAGKQWPFADAPAPIRTGAVIRRLGIDRLPQSLAVLAGRLSLVGPRAAEIQSHERTEREFPLYGMRTVVKPGLTGWEQLHRESRMIYDKLRPLEYDLYYVKHQSLALDLRILALTALMILRRIGR